MDLSTITELIVCFCACLFVGLFSCFWVQKTFPFVFGSSKPMETTVHYNKEMGIFKCESTALLEMLTTNDMARRLCCLNRYVIAFYS